MKEPLHQIKYLLSGFFSKRMLLVFLIIFLIGIISFIPLFKADYDYWDDVVRFNEGSYGWMWQGRFLSEALMRVLVPGSMMDVSPLIQILAIGALSLSSCIVIYVFSCKKPSFLSVLFGLAFLFNPWFLECLSYKNDALLMSLSVLCTVFPFIFIEDRKSFIVMSVIGLTCMCNFYQSSGGLYIMMVVFIMYKMWTEEDINVKDILIFAIESALVFLLVVGLFSAIVSFFGMSWRDVSPFGISNLASGICSNVYTLFLISWASFSSFSKVLIVLSFIIGIIFAVYNSKRNKLVSFLFLSIAIFISLSLSQGVYIFLETPVTFARTIFCIGFVLPILLIIAVPDRKIFIPLFSPAIYFVWVLIICVFAYGNALNQQKIYDLNFANHVGYELSNYDTEARYISIEGGYDFAPDVKRTMQVFPIFRNLIRSSLSAGYNLVPYQLYVRENGLDLELTDEPFDFTNSKVLVNKKDFSIYLNQERLHLVVHP